MTARDFLDRLVEKALDGPHSIHKGKLFYRTSKMETLNFRFQPDNKKNEKIPPSHSLRPLCGESSISCMIKSCRLLTLEATASDNIQLKKALLFL